MQYIIEGEQVGFTELKQDYVEKYRNWINDLEVSKFISTFGSIITKEEEQNWYESQTETDEPVFTIHYLPEDKPIGNCGLHRIDKSVGRAEMGIVLGEKNYWNRGLGTESVKLITDFGFTALNLHVIYLAYKNFNERAKNVYEKVGYRESGRQRDFYRVDGKYYDKVIMDIFREDFYESNEHLIRDSYMSKLD